MSSTMAHQNKNVQNVMEQVSSLPFFKSYSHKVLPTVMGLFLIRDIIYFYEYKCV